MTLDQEPDVALALEIAPGVFVSGGVVDLNGQALKRVKEFLGWNEPVVRQMRVAELQSLHSNATQKLAVTGMRVKTHTISVEKSEFVQECKFRHSLNSAIRATRGLSGIRLIWVLAWFSAPGQKLRGAERPRFRACNKEEL